MNKPTTPKGTARPKNSGQFLEQDLTRLYGQPEPKVEEKKKETKK